MGYRLNRLDEPVFMAVAKPMLTEFAIHYRLENCVVSWIGFALVLISWKLKFGLVTIPYTHEIDCDNTIVQIAEARVSLHSRLHLWRTEEKKITHCRCALNLKFVNQCLGLFKRMASKLLMCGLAGVAGTSSRHFLRTAPALQKMTIHTSNLVKSEEGNINY